MHLRIYDYVKKYKIFIITAILTIILNGNIGFTNTVYTSSPFLNGESFLCFSLSKIMQFIMLYLFTNFILLLYEKIRQKDYKQNTSIWIISLSLFIVLITVLFGVYPACFSYEMDNLGNFLTSLELKPTYWHSIYMGCWYLACMMIIPHPIFIQCVQIIFFITVFIFIFQNLKILAGKYAYLLFLIFLEPSLFYVIYNPYRNCLFTIAVIFMLADTILFYLNNKSHTAESLVKRILFYTWGAAFRPEGIIIVFIYITIHIIFLYPKDKKFKIIFGILSIICFLVFHNINAIGTNKVYGKGYSIVACLNQMKNILNDPNVNLNYKEAKDDLNNFKAVMPIKWIKEAGVNGYRSYNYERGNKDFNITVANNEDAAKFITSYINLVFHNPKPFIWHQIFLLNGAVSLNLPLPGNIIHKYRGKHRVKGNWFANLVGVMGNIRSRFAQYDFKHNSFYNENYIKTINCSISIWRIFNIESLRKFSIVISLILLPYYLMSYIKTKNNKNIIIVATITGIFSMFTITFLAMAEGRPPYFYPTCFSFMILIIILLSIGLAKKFNNENLE